MKDVPAGWQLIGLPESLEIQKGKRPRDLGSRSDARRIAYVNIAAFEKGIITQYAPEQNAPLCDPRDVLMVWDGSRAGLVGRGRSGFVGSTLARLRSDLFDHDYLFHFISSKYSDINERTKGIGIPHVDPEVLRSINIPLPPIEEQKRIAGKIETIFRSLELAQSEITQGASKLRDYRRKLLVSAMSGEITEKWRSDSIQSRTGEELLRSIKERRRVEWETQELAKYSRKGVKPPANWKSKYRPPLAQAQENTTLSSLPATWTWSTIGECFLVTVGATPSRKEPRYWGGGIPWVSSGEIKFNIINSTKETISEEGLNNSSTQVNPAGSVMLAMIGEGKTRGQTAILGIDAANNQNSACILTNNSGVPSLYVYYWLQSRYEEIRRSGSGNNQPALNKSIIEQICIPIPPQEEMKEIVTRIERELSAIKAQELALESISSNIQLQRGKVYSDAFSGSLTKRSALDEPVANLIARVKKQREVISSRPAPLRRPALKADKNQPAGLLQALKKSGDWTSAQDAFAACGIFDGADTETIESIYADLRQLLKTGEIEIRAIRDQDGLKKEDQLRARKQ